MKQIKVGKTVFFDMPGPTPLLKCFAYGEVIKLNGDGTADVRHAGNGKVLKLPVHELRSR